jgi:uncharacterized RDD family membrane protein YckC
MAAREIERAVARNKRVVALRLGEAQPGGDLDFLIASSSWIDVREEQMAAQLGTLAASIRQIAGGGEAGHDVRAGRPEPRVAAPSSSPSPARPPAPSPPVAAATAVAPPPTSATAQTPRPAPVPGGPIPGRVAPAGPGREVAEAGAARPVTKSERFTHLMVDYIAGFAAAFVVSIVVGFFFGILIGITGAEPSGEDLDAFFGLVGIGAFIGYYVFFEAVSGRTAGKLLTGCKVVAADGSPPRVGQIIGRSLARMIPFEPFSVLFSADGIGWHDSLSGTRVVRMPRRA